MQSESDDNDAGGAFSDHPPTGVSLETGDMHSKGRERITYSRDELLQLSENADPQAEHRERICYSRDQLLLLQEAGEISEDILKIKQDFEVEIKAARDLIKELPEKMAGSKCKFYSAGSCKFGSSCKFSHRGHYPEKTEIGKVQLNFSGLPSRPGERECPYYMRTGCCKFSTNCRFHHPDPIIDEHDPFSGFISGGSPEQLASGATLGIVSFPQSLHLTSDWDVYQATGELIKELPERANGLADCKFYLAGCCKFGTTCKFSHHGHYQENIELGNAQLNFSGLPSPLGEKECPYCLGTGGFKFSTNCRFHHTDPHITGLDNFSGFANGRLPIQLASGASLATSFSQNLHLTPAWDFYQQKQAVTPKQPFYCDVCKVECNSQAMLDSHLNGKKHKAQLEEPTKAHVDGPDECEHYGKLANDKLVTVVQPRKDYNSVKDDKPSKEDCLVTIKDIGYKSEPVMATNHITGFEKKVNEQTTERRENVKEHLDEYPQRPGEPDCSYFIKYGTCKYRYVCKFHHPSSTSRGLAAKADDHVHHQGRREEYPDKPGEPECSYFLKFGSCMFRAECKYHHPIDRLPRVAPCIFNPNGLPLRPDQPVCSYYSRFGICKFGPRCRFDHPVEYVSSVPTEDLRSSQGSSADESGWCTG